MSRVHYTNDDWGSIEATLNYGRWERNSVTTLRSKRGQAALRELEQALLALPEPKLYANTFCEVTEEGEVQACVLGALAYVRGLEVPDSFNWGEDSDPAEEQAYWANAAFGIAYTLAWNLIERNDEIYGKLTPEERYTKMLAWIRDQLTGAPTEPARWG